MAAKLYYIKVVIKSDEELGYLHMKDNGKLNIMKGSKDLKADGPASFRVTTITQPAPRVPAVITIQSIAYPQYYLTGHTVGAKPMTVNGIYEKEDGSSCHWIIQETGNTHRLQLSPMDQNQQLSANMFFFIQHHNDDKPSFNIGEQQPIDEFQFEDISDLSSSQLFQR
jgi:hypothetical protein